MNFLPEFGITIWNGFLFIIPLLFVRIVIPKWLHRDLQKLNHFAPTFGIENTALTGYFITNTILVFIPLIFRLDLSNTYRLIGFIAIYFVGFVFLVSSVLTFSKDNSLITKGVYRISRNPMYIGYLFLFLGIGMIVNSILYLLLVVVYQICVHLLILSEERWCLSVFQEDFEYYKNHTRRYFGIKNRT